MFSLAREFWSVHRKIKILLAHLVSYYESANRRPEHDLVLKLRELIRNLDGVLELSAKAGLTNRTLTAGSIHSLQLRNEELLDLVERFELALNPEVAKAVKDSIEEFRRGETVSLSSL